MYDTLKELKGYPVTVTLKSGNEYSGTLEFVSLTLIRLERTVYGDLRRRIVLVSELAAVDLEVS